MVLFFSIRDLFLSFLEYETENYGSWVWVIRAIQVFSSRSLHFLIIYSCFNSSEFYDLQRSYSIVTLHQSYDQSNTAVLFFYAKCDCE